jgi:small GTP-binding protein
VYLFISILVTCRQYLDNLEVERERGITVKAQTATMTYLDPRSGTEYLLNLIDTPGHVDFSSEVSKSLRACQGALLLVDSTQSVQAQTLANYGKAKDLSVSVIPIITKIDLPFAQPEEAALSMHAVFGFDPDTCIMTSAKNFEGIDAVIEAIIDGVPSPAAFCGDKTDKFKGRIVDSWYEEHRGLVCLGK